MSECSHGKQKPLILASSSPRRRELLNQIGLRFEVIPSNVEEVKEDGEYPISHVLRLAEEKALDISRKVENSWIIGADTIVLVDGEILGKPSEEQEAYQMLMKLSDREHKVLTGFCIIDSETGESTKKHVETTVMIKKLTHEEITEYIKTREPFDKAGSYAIQGRGSFMVR
ncbi:MAG: Maf family protein, partial [Thermodesulfobacteriota bacterium]|nr:Maf family protein [Thermodesulfobacteriota bacterium]